MFLNFIVFKDPEAKATWMDFVKYPAGSTMAFVNMFAVNGASFGLDYLKNMMHTSLASRPALLTKFFEKLNGAEKNGVEEFFAKVESALAQSAAQKWMPRGGMEGGLLIG